MLHYLQITYKGPETLARQGGSGVRFPCTSAINYETLRPLNGGAFCFDKKVVYPHDF
jgi:hypothetical protein